MHQPKDYHYYTTNDFIADERFIQWVKQPDAALDAFWQQWLARHPEKLQQVQEARAFLQQLQFTARLPSEAAVQASLQQSLARIEALEQQQLSTGGGRGRRRIWAWAAAAAVLAGGLLLAGQLLRGPQEKMLRYAGLPNEVRTIVLPDSSVVMLNANAEISFRNNWLGRGAREVWLKGEAFFDIRPLTAGAATARAFMVHSGNMDIEVLGTSFNVKEGQRFTNISLNTGRIKVRCSELPEAPLYMGPGDFVQYSAKNNRIIKKKVNADLYAVWRNEQQQQLHNVSLQDMATYIEDNYGYHVRITSPGLAQAKVSGGLRVKDENLLLATLSFAYNVRIDRKADTLFIQSNNQR